MMQFKTCLVLFLLSLFLVSCRSDEVTVQVVPKEKLVSSQQGSSQVSWDVPSAWKEVPSSGLRLASFLVPVKQGDPLDVSVISLFGQSGSLLANVNRWRGQLRLKPLRQDELSSVVRTRELNGRTVMFVDLVSEELMVDQAHKKSIKAAIIGQGSATYFFKMVGRSQDVKVVSKAFETFIRGVRFKDGS